MFTPQEVSEKTFPKSSSFSSGYDLAAVDEFLDTLTEDYTALYKENAALKAKLKILAEKLEEYRATEDTMRSMLLAAQKMAASMTDEAKEKSEKMLAEARSQREQILEEAQNAATVANRDFQQKTEAARQKLSAAEEAMKDYVAKSLALCRTQTQFLEQLPHSDLPAQEDAEAQETVPAAQAAPAQEAAPAQVTRPRRGSCPRPGSRPRPGSCPGRRAPGRRPDPGHRPHHRKGHSQRLRKAAGPRARPHPAPGHGLCLRVQAGPGRAEVRPQLRPRKELTKMQRLAHPKPLHPHIVPGTP